jgi:hypothetical protein
VSSDLLPAMIGVAGLNSPNNPASCGSQPTRNRYFSELSSPVGVSTAEAVAGRCIIRSQWTEKSSNLPSELTEEPYLPDENANFD